MARSGAGSAGAVGGRPAGRPEERVWAGRGWPRWGCGSLGAQPGRRRRGGTDGRTRRVLAADTTSLQGRPFRVPGALAALGSCRCPPVPPIETPALDLPQDFVKEPEELLPKA